YFFGILYQEAGGSLTGVGLTFLLFALSEVPVMLVVQGLADRYSPAWLLLAAALLADLRWLLYAAPVPPWVLVATFPLNGLSNGVFLALIPVLTSQLAGPHLKATALAAAGVAGFGLGAIFTSTVGGVILDRWGVAAIYVFLGLLGVVGVVASAMVVRLTPPAAGR
ncbi:MAG: MFS transporter, partial [Bacillota bacterium]